MFVVKVKDWVELLKLILKIFSKEEVVLKVWRGVGRLNGDSYTK